MSTPPEQIGASGAQESQVAVAQPPEGEEAPIEIQPTPEKVATSSPEGDRLSRMEAALSRIEAKLPKQPAEPSRFKKIAGPVWKGVKATTRFAVFKAAPIIFLLSLIGNKADEVSACIETKTQQAAGDTERLIGEEKKKLGQTKKPDERMEIMIELQRLQAQQIREETARMRDQALVPVQCLERSIPHNREQLERDAAKAVRRFVEIPAWVGKLSIGRQCPPDVSIKPES